MILVTSDFLILKKDTEFEIQNLKTAVFCPQKFSIMVKALVPNPIHSADMQMA